MFSGPGVENDGEVGVTFPVTKERQKKEMLSLRSIPVFLYLHRSLDNTSISRQNSAS